MSFRLKENEFINAIYTHGIHGQQTQLTSFYLADLKQENIYPIDLNTRTITVPPLLGVQQDHQSNIIYFAMPRYYNGVDLAKTTGIVQYQLGNRANEKYVYAVPYYDIESFKYFVQYNKISSPKDHEIKTYYEKTPEFTLVDPELIGEEIVNKVHLEDNKYYKRKIEYKLITEFFENGDSYYDYYLKTSNYSLVDTENIISEADRIKFTENIRNGLYYKKQGNTYTLAEWASDTIISRQNLKNLKFYVLSSYTYSPIFNLNKIFSLYEGNDLDNTNIYYEKENNKYYLSSDTQRVDDKSYYVLNEDLYEKIETDDFYPVLGQEVMDTYNSSGQLFYVETGEDQYQLTNDTFVLSGKNYYTKEILQDIMIVPWSITGLLTKYEGIVYFSLKFFILDNVDGELEIIYELNTQIANSRVSKGFDYIIESNLDTKVVLGNELYESLQAFIDASGINQLYWNDIKLTESNLEKPIITNIEYLSETKIINISWHFNYQKGYPDTFVIYRKRNDEPYERICKNLKGNRSGENTYEDKTAKNLTPGTYYYYVEAIRIDGGAELKSESDVKEVIMT